MSIPEHTNLNGMASLAYRVRQGQAKLCRSHRITPFSEIVNRSTWRQLSDIYVSELFPRSARKKQTIILGETSDVMLASFAFYPLQYRLHGHVKPDWSSDTVLSFLRRGTAPNMNQFYLSRYKIDKDISCPNSATSNFCRLVKLSEGDEKFAYKLFEKVADVASGTTRRASFARLVIAPWSLADWDEDEDKKFRFTAYPSERSRLRVSKFGTASYVRMGDEVWMLGDKYVSKRNDRDMVDIREYEGFEWNGFFLRWAENNGKFLLTIRVSKEQMKFYRTEFRAFLESKTSPAHKAKMFNDLAANIRLKYKHCAGASDQLFELHEWAGKKFRQHIQATDPNLRFCGCKLQYDKKLVLPRPNPYANIDSVSLEFWKAMHSPYKFDL